MAILIRCLLVLAAAVPGTQDGPPIASTNPVYELTLPWEYVPVARRVMANHFSRSRGRESWARVSVILTDSKEDLPQNLSGLRAEDVQSRVPFPPEAKWTFQPLRWKDFDIGSFEYRAVVGDLPVIGLAAVLPLQHGSLTIMVYAPEPLEKECREDFSETLSRITKAPTSWHSPEYYRRVRSMNVVGTVGLGLMGLYVVAWAVVFRGDVMRGHWLRVAWLALVAVLLFIPITSPGEVTYLNNLLVNALMPVVLLLFAVRRIKLGIEMG